MTDPRSPQPDLRALTEARLAEALRALDPADWPQYGYDKSARAILAALSSSESTETLDAAPERPVLDDVVSAMEAFAAARERDVRANRDAPDNINEVVAAAIRGRAARLTDSREQTAAPVEGMRE